MKGKIILLILLIACLPWLLKQIRHDENESNISCAIDILKSANTHKIGNLKGSSIRFSATDFGRDRQNWKEITVLGIDDPSLGRLIFRGNKIEEAICIDRDEIHELCFIPYGDEIVECNVRYRIGSGEDSLRICLSDYEDIPPICYDQSYETYRNIGVYGTLENSGGSGEVHFEIKTSCDNGILELDQKSGDFVYLPKRNFIGTDRFSYEAVDEYGNRSEIKEVFFDIDKAEYNLFFYDSVGHPLHKTAVDLCLSGALPYEYDDSSLPILNGEQQISVNQFKHCIQTVLNPQGISSDKKEPVFANDDREILTRFDAVDLCYHLLTQHDDEWDEVMQAQSDQLLEGFAKMELIPEEWLGKKEEAMTRWDCIDFAKRIAAFNGSL